MIEFKAECGHTIRAKDGDEGKVVRCSYCGRTMQVPDKAEDEFESLFTGAADLDAGEPVSAGATVRSKRRRPGPGKVPKTTAARRSTDGFNPFAVVLKMAYVAGIVIVLIICAKLAISYWTAESGRKTEGKRVTDAGRGSTSGERRNTQSTGSGKRGLITVRLDKKKGGIYINSVPRGAEVRLRKRDAGGESDIEEVFLDSKARRVVTDSAVTLDSGMYDVVVALRINNQDLMKYEGYGVLRRAIQEGGSDRLLETYFLPDEAVDISSLDLPNRRCVVARRYEVEVTGTEWTPLTALFLPDAPVAELVRYLPRQQAYGFDEEYVKGELDFYGVPQQDQTYIVDALRRSGMIMYRLDEPSAYRCFMIDLIEGVVISWVSSDRG